MSNTYIIFCVGHLSLNIDVCGETKAAIEAGEAEQCLNSPQVPGLVFISPGQLVPSYKTFSVLSRPFYVCNKTTATILIKYFPVLYKIPKKGEQQGAQYRHAQPPHPRNNSLLDTKSP